VPSAVIVGLAVALGTLLTPPTGPPATPGQASFVDAGTCLDGPMAPHAAPGGSGWATLCDNGRDVRITLQAIGLPPGEQYTAWLSYRVIPPGCRDVPCPALDLDGGSPAGAMQQIGHAIAQPDSSMELTTELRDLHLLHGAEITVQLQGELGRGGPHLQARVTVP
jgi:hypothetical protein